ncbi:hypothetical protein SAMN03159338_1622 [Sphingomonas sp. NFR04]|uniref:hypothetical protein n=1 Tax=Sphingomonas sp. NFR04 TaxID=1566283 RepID=UPI0008EE019E|nr:hypothetical protein [Sphingomonas sp. NFR04]SFJ51385.1 hypothetical protein SAMN03159338_1622 [Sphingomonas sp. NFR04]
MKFGDFVAEVIARILPTQSVDVLVKSLTKLAAKLDAAERLHNDRARLLRDEVNRLRAEAFAAEQEAARAGRTRDKIADLTA